MEFLTITYTCMNYGFNGASGKVVVTTDKIDFYLSNFKKAALDFLDIRTKNYSVRLNTFNEDKITYAIKTANPNINIQYCFC